MDRKRFARSSNALIFGVCAGLTDYTGIPLWLMRVLWVLMALISWFGWLAVGGYIVLAAVMSPPEGAPAGERFWHNTRGHNVKIAVAIGLICFGGTIILEAIVGINLQAYLIPVALIVGGAVLIAFAFGMGSKNK